MYHCPLSSSLVCKFFCLTFCKTEIYVTFQAEARLAAKRAARAEARDIRMRELERQQREVPEAAFAGACVLHVCSVLGWGKEMMKVRSHGLRSPFPGQEHRELL